MVLKAGDFATYMYNQQFVPFHVISLREVTPTLSK